MPRYDDLDFKIPVEADDYEECSQFVTKTIGAIINDAIERGHNKIIINTNLKHGLPMENINKIAGPFVEAWAVETFQAVVEDSKNRYQLINVEAKERLYMADVILQFKRKRKADTAITAEVDVKATAEDIKESGKSPNITSFRRIRTAYVTDPDYMFIILSLKHRVHCQRKEASGLMDGIMEVVSYNAYDLKYLSPKDFNFNPALGSGQIQVADIRYVTLQRRTTWEFCQLLDRKYLSSSKRTLKHWINLAKQLKWIKYE